MIDSVEINYADWAYLQFNKMINIYDPIYLELVPTTLMKSLDFILKLVWCVINSKPAKSLPLSRIEKEVEFLTKGHKINDFFSIESEKELEHFLLRRVRMFKINGKKEIEVIPFDEKEEFTLMSIAPRGWNPQPNKRKKVRTGDDVDN